MPEEPEFDNDKLGKLVYNTSEEVGKTALQKRVALMTVILALLATFASLLASHAQRKAEIIKAEVQRLKDETSDQWAYYGDKRLHLRFMEAAEEPWLALGKPVPSRTLSEENRYAAELKFIAKAARELMHKRDLTLLEIARLEQSHDRFLDTIAIFQVAMTLGALAAVTKRRQAWLVALAIGTLAVVLFTLDLVWRFV
jgi:hypothetical protein